MCSRYHFRWVIVRKSFPITISDKPRCKRNTSAIGSRESNRRLLEAADPQVTQALAREYVEVVEPKGGHYFLQLTRPFESTNDASLKAFLSNDPRPLTQSLFVLARGEAAQGHLISDEQLFGRAMKGLQNTDALPQIGWLRNRIRV
jgi:hypothetical protein